MSRKKDDGGVALRVRCYSCGHRMAFFASACPQCGIEFDDDKKDPKRWPDNCQCKRCTEARGAR
jgi:predicted amidophosphoribosyltransferase